MTRWASPSVGPVGGPLKDVWSMPWGSSGMWRWDIQRLKSPNTLVKMTSKLKFKQMFAGVFSYWRRKYGCVLSVSSTVTVKSSPAFLLPLFYHMCLPHVSSCSTTLSPALLHPRLAPCVLCVRAPLSGPPVLRASWSRLLWETFWHGEGCNMCWLLPSCISPAWKVASAWRLHWYINPEGGDRIGSRYGTCFCCVLFWIFRISALNIRSVFD